MASIEQALERLREGNRKFRLGRVNPQTSVQYAERPDRTRRQDPFAAVIACSDSRVPVELLFGQAIGDLFVIRVAGNIVAPTQLGSVELALQELGTRLVVVLGHTNCAAIEATLAAIRRPDDAQSPNVLQIIERIRPAVEAQLGKAGAPTIDEAKRRAVRANIRAAVKTLYEASELLRARARTGDLAIRGAEYSLETGIVEFLEDEE
ncbi:MAG: carbonic anhydrase [Candidatus Eisenbacteria bacterium]|nr:carbonic anhydrase [Candidatus Eisenbacteria bacterium]